MKSNRKASIWSNLLNQIRQIALFIFTYVVNKPLSSFLWLIFIIFAAWIFVMAIWADAFPDWVGFGAYDEDILGVRAKTLWDWMQLLIVPATLAAGAFFLGKWQADNEKNKTLDNQRQALLDSFVDKMAELLLDKNLRNANSDEAQSIARTRTLTLFRQLDGDRKGNALQFLFESGLISGSHPVIELLGLDLDNASLIGASLIRSNLSGLNCKSANLQNANFEEAIMTGCNLSDSNLQDADFTNTLLDQAILSGCNLLGANFLGADLYMADFTNALVTLEQLKHAKSLEYTTLPDGSIYRINLMEE